MSYRLILANTPPTGHPRAFHLFITFFPLLYRFSLKVLSIILQRHQWLNQRSLTHLCLSLLIESPPQVSAGTSLSCSCPGLNSRVFVKVWHFLTFFPQGAQWEQAGATCGTPVMEPVPTPTLVGTDHQRRASSPGHIQVHPGNHRRCRTLPVSQLWWLFSAEVTVYTLFCVWVFIQASD